MTSELEKQHNQDSKLSKSEMTLLQFIAQRGSAGSAEGLGNLRLEIEKLRFVAGVLCCVVVWCVVLCCGVVE